MYPYYALLERERQIVDFDALLMFLFHVMKFITHFNFTSSFSVTITIKIASSHLIIPA